MSSFLQAILPSLIELLMLSAFCFAMHSNSVHRLYPAFNRLIVFRIASSAVIVTLMLSRRIHLISGMHAYSAYFYTYWASFLVDAVLIFMVVHEMYRHATVALPGLQKLGAIAFRWAVAISGLMAFVAALSPHAHMADLLVTTASVVMRCENILVLCLIGFFAFSAQTLGLSYRSRVFGVTFGLAMMATSGLVASALFNSSWHALAGYVNYADGFIQIAAMALWMVYFLKPEPQRKLVMIETTAPLMRWNEIARTFGNTGGQVVVSHPASFMTDVHDVVDQVMKQQPKLGIVS